MRLRSQFVEQQQRLDTIETLDNLRVQSIGLEQ